MNLFWSIYVGVLVILTMGLALLLYFYGTRVKIPIDDKGTSGHSWDNGGLREAVHRLPRWWAIMSLTMFVWGSRNIKVDGVRESSPTGFRVGCNCLRFSLRHRCRSFRQPQCECRDA